MNTYVLGAGASLHAGYPLARDLGNDLLDWLRLGKLQHTLTDHCGNIQQVHDLYGTLDNLERILTDLRDPDPTSPATAIGPAVRSCLLDSFLISIPEYFYDRLLLSSGLFYERWAREKVEEGDVVITFNYDVACERELRRRGVWEIGDGYGFSLGLNLQSSRVEVLKLHGSANWLTIPFGGMRMGQVSPEETLGGRPVIYGSRQFDSLGYSREICDPACEYSPNAAGRPALIMPGPHKRFFSVTSFGRELEEFWGSLWLKAEDALASSQNIVIIGYSLPVADEKARELLLQKANHSADITVCCGRDSAHILDQFKQVGFEKVHTLGRGFFEDYLEVRPRPMSSRAGA